MSIMYSNIHVQYCAYWKLRSLFSTFVVTFVHVLCKVISSVLKHCNIGKQLTCACVFISTNIRISILQIRNMSSAGSREVPDLVTRILRQVMTHGLCQVVQLELEGIRGTSILSVS